MTNTSSALIRTSVVIFSLIILATSRVRADTNDFGGWLIANAHISIDRKKTYQVYAEGQPRLGDDWQRAATFQARAAFVYNWDQNLGFYAGYAWPPLFYDIKYQQDYRDEQRLWQQVIYRHDLFGFQWQHRIREEQRFQMRTAGISHRFRYLLRASYALNDAKDFGFTAYDEVMFTLNDIKGSFPSGYERNRLFFGPYWLVNNARYEIGYLAEHLQHFGSEERWAHAIVATASYNF